VKGVCPRILIVDDDRDTREMMPVWLGIEGEKYEIATRDSFFEASKLIASHPFDLYIFDFAVSDTNAAEFCRTLRRIDPKTPILIYSALSRSVAGQAAVDAGADVYLEKPNDLDRIGQVVKRLLEQRPVVQPPKRRFGRRMAPRSIL
jgi:DNA-binding response OmpR family regulator